jgi:hypothetical protein
MITEGGATGMTEFVYDGQLRRVRLVLLRTNGTRYSYSSNGARARGISKIYRDVELRIRAAEEPQ